MEEQKHWDANVKHAGRKSAALESVQTRKKSRKIRAVVRARASTVLTRVQIMMPTVSPGVLEVGGVLGGGSASPSGGDFFSFLSSTVTKTRRFVAVEIRLSTRKF